MPASENLEINRRNRFVDRHQGDSHDWMNRYRSLCGQAHQEGHTRLLEAMAADLFRRASDDRNLIVATEHVCRCSGQTLGPTDLRPLSALDQNQRFECARQLRDWIRSGTYQRGPVRQVRLPKYPRGHRVIQVADFEDRIIAAGVQQVLDPFIDPWLSPDCYGFREGRSRLQALARLDKLIRDGARAVVSVDIRQAFDTIPQPPLWEILRAVVPHEALIEHVIAVVGGQSAVGLPQGNAICPLLMNLYCDRRLDRPWRRKHHDWPLLRYADDMLVVTPSLEQAHQARARLERLVTSAQLSLKDTTSQCVIELAGGEGFNWLGHRLVMADGRIKPRLRHDEHTRLVFRFRANGDLSYRQVDPDALALSWLHSRGPTYAHENRAVVLDMVLTAAEEARCQLTVGRRRLRDAWRNGWRQWRKIAKMGHVRHAEQGGVMPGHMVGNRGSVQK